MRRRGSLLPQKRPDRNPAPGPGFIVMTVIEAGAASPSTARDVFVARQPIFDRVPERVGYELLYRSAPDALTAHPGPSATAMCGDTALHALLSIGLDRLTAGGRAFVNITQDHLLGELYKVFDPGQVVLELLESIDASADVLDACRRALADGYVLALDDYDGRSSLEPLLSLVEVVKVDVLPDVERGELAGLAPMVKRLKAMGLTVLAERVETKDVLDQCLDIGFDLFQGFVFSRPETLDGRSASIDQAVVFRIITMLQQPHVAEWELEDAFRVHPPLSLMLLRIVNSASFGGRNVQSISHAIRLVGLEALSRWMLIMLVASVGTQSPMAHEAVLMTLVRGRFCEVVSEYGGYGDPPARFLVGMLSCMDVLLGVPMRELLERLPVSPEVREALLHGRGPHAEVLRLVVAYEQAEWDTVEQQVRGMRGTFTQLYTESVSWAVEHLVAL